ncbi:uncharacterized protein At4g06598-like [Silene latifolia]|uniref:uncharacterized protein At4g06598-like n=1 Tax=Silene latifolia TaxID=37657 RepID=UPI003D770DA6
MANAKGSTNLRSLMPNGKNFLLPPKSPFPSINPTYTEYVPSTNSGQKSFSKSREGNAYHQRTSSESFIEEQPSWLDELLNEPDTPVRKGHRRSSSDSFAYLDAASMSNIEYVPASHDGSKFRPATSPLWGARNFEHGKETVQGSLYADSNFYGKSKNRPWDARLAPINHQSALYLSGDKSVSQSQGSHAAGDLDSGPSTGSDMQGESGSHDPMMSSEKKDGSRARPTSENETKRAKQQFAQRSRVRKLQYIAELERNVQALQVEGSEVSAELEFLNQQNLILGMENKALKHRLESLNQEKLIKYLEHEVLEREKGRLRALYQLQQRQQQPELQHQSQPRQRPSSSHRRNNSRDLDSQFANLSLKHKEANSGTDSISGPVRI